MRPLAIIALLLALWTDAPVAAQSWDPSIPGPTPFQSSASPLSSVPAVWTADDASVLETAVWLTQVPHEPSDWDGLPERFYRDHQLRGPARPIESWLPRQKLSLLKVAAHFDSLGVPKVDSALPLEDVAHTWRTPFGGDAAGDRQPMEGRAPPQESPPPGRSRLWSDDQFARFRALPRYEASASWGDSWMVSGQILDTLEHPWLVYEPLGHTPRAPLGEGWSVARIGVERALADEGFTGFYAFEHVSLDNYWSGVSAFDAAGAGAAWGMASGDNHRAGLQAQSSDGRWTLEASGFYAESGEEDSLFAAPHYQWVRGAQLAIHAGVTSRWKSSVRVSGVESRIRSPAEGGTWSPPKRQSNSTVSLWNRFKLYERGDHQLELGVGTTLVTEYKSSYENSMILPGFSRWDVGLFYRREGLDARLYIESVLDSGYYEGLDYLLNDPASPLSIEMQIQLRY